MPLRDPWVLAIRDDAELARQIVADVDEPRRGVLGSGRATIESRGAGNLTQLLVESGWQADESWTPLHRDLAGPVKDVRVRVEIVGSGRADSWVAVHWSAFRGTPFTDQDRRNLLDKWLVMAAGPFYSSARSLVAFDGHDNAVAIAMVWSAGPGRPGLIEPMGVHQNHRGYGYGTTITRAAASALRDMGSSSAIVCAESSNVGAVSTYTSAGFTARRQVADLCRAR